MFRFYALFSCLIFHVFSIPRQSSKPLIVGGIQVDPPFRYPFVASVRDQFGSHFCAGSMIASNILLTAAHCSVFREPVNDFYVHVHRHNLSKNVDEEDGLIYNVGEIVIHPNFGNTLLNYDIALWFLIPQFDDKIFQNDSFPELDNGKYSSAGHELTVIGWGSTDDYRYIPSPVLLETQVTVQQRHYCEKVFAFPY
jgi:secreted trypsin-like serine protease